MNSAVNYGYCCELWILLRSMDIAVIYQSCSMLPVCLSIVITKGDMMDYSAAVIAGKNSLAGVDLAANQTMAGS